MKYLPIIVQQNEVMASVICPGPQALRQAEVLRASLKSSVDDFNVGSSGWSSRQMLQDLYKSILLNDLEFALDKKVEQDLWNSAFKSQIDFLRQQAKENRGSLQSSDIQAVLTLFLEAASGFYIQLLQEICLIYSLDLPGHTKSSYLGILPDVDVSSTTKRPHTQSCYYVCQDCLVHLGDIARYCDDSNQAEVFYKHALILVPSNGQPYNQLAILASSKGDQLATVYFYCRSIAVKNQFPAASTNLHKIFNKICSSTFTSSLSNKTEVVQGFLRFHGLLYLDKDFSEAKSLKDKVVDGIKHVLQQGCLTKDDILRVSAITLFTLYHIKCGRGTDDLEEFDCISKVEEESWKLCLEFAVNLFDVVLTYMIANPDEVSSQSALVYASVFCEWLASNASTAWKQDINKSPEIWETFASFLNQISPSNEPNEHNNNNKSDIPLYEDWELHCFIPLLSFQKKLNFSIKKTKIANEDSFRKKRLVQFGSSLCSHSTRLLTKVEDIVTGIAKFSLHTETNQAENVPSNFQERPKRVVKGFEPLAGQHHKQQHQPQLSPAGLLPQKSPSPTPFTETSSLFNNIHGAIGRPAERPSFLATPQVAQQYSLFQSGWKAPLTSAFGSSGSSQSSPTHELSPIGQPLTNQGSITPGELQSPGGTIPTFPSPSRPSAGPLDGFGLSENWGTGVWGPAKTSSSSVVGHPPSHQVQSMWGQDLSPGQGLSPLQQLLHDQQKRKDGT